MVDLCAHLRGTKYTANERQEDDRSRHGERGFCPLNRTSRMAASVDAQNELLSLRQHEQTAYAGCVQSNSSRRRTPRSVVPDAATFPCHTTCTALPCFPCFCVRRFSYIPCIC
jgi:hypothetical protein